MSKIGDVVFKARDIRYVKGRPYPINPADGWEFFTGNSWSDGLWPTEKEAKEACSRFFSDDNKKISIGTVKYLSAWETISQAGWYFRVENGWKGVFLEEADAKYEAEEYAKEQARTFLRLLHADKTPLGTVRQEPRGYGYQYLMEDGWSAPYVYEDVCKGSAKSYIEDMNKKAEERKSTPIPEAKTTMRPTMNFKWVNYQSEICPGTWHAHPPVLQQLWVQQKYDQSTPAFLQETLKEEWRNIPCETVKLPARQYTISDKEI